MKIKTEKYTINVNYDQPLEQLLKVGRFVSCPKPGIFPSQETGKARIDILLVDFGQDIWTEDVIRQMDKEGLRPATLKELLALDAAFPYLHMHHPILALGSSFTSPINKLKYAPILRTIHGIDIIGYNGLWLYTCRFATVLGQIENAGSIRRDAIMITTDRTLPVVVDHRKSIAQLLQEGKYYASDIFTIQNASHFKSLKKTKVELTIHLIGFEREVTGEEVVTEMSARGFRPATIKELLALGADPAVRRFVPIIALGSTWCDEGDCLRVPSLHRMRLEESGEGPLGFFHHDSFIGPHCTNIRFAAVRN